MKFDFKRKVFHVHAFEYVSEISVNLSAPLC